MGKKISIPTLTTGKDLWQTTKIGHLPSEELFQRKNVTLQKKISSRFPSKILNDNHAFWKLFKAETLKAEIVMKEQVYLTLNPKSGNTNWTGNTRLIN